MTMGDGRGGYIGTGEDRRRGGYETYTSPRYRQLADGFRFLPYAREAAEHLLGNCLELIEDLLKSKGDSV